MKDRIKKFREDHPYVELALAGVAVALGVAGVGYLHSKTRLNDANAKLVETDTKLVDVRVQTEQNWLHRDRVNMERAEMAELAAMERQETARLAKQKAKS